MPGTSFTLVDPTGLRGPLTPAAAGPTVTAVQLGADPDAIDELARAHRELSTRVRRRVHSLHLGSSWTGPDARRFTDDYNQLVADPSLRAAVLLESLAAELVRQARDQRSASSAPAVGEQVWVDESGDGRFVHRVGPSDATTVVILVPGVGTDLGDRPAMIRDAERVHEALAPAVSSLAVFAWLKYDPPDTVPGAISPHPANVGAARLVADIDHLRRPGRVPPVERLVVLGHSYGGVVTGRAVAGGARADAVVLLGAPGIGLPDADRVVGRSDVRVYASRAEDDPIGYVPVVAGPVYGPDPLDVATPLRTEASGHSDYLSDPVLLERLADVIGEPVRS